MLLGLYFGAGTRLGVKTQLRFLSFFVCEALSRWVSSSDLSEYNITTPEVKILPPAEGECRNDREKKGEKTLTCVASSFYPDHVRVFWQINGVNVTHGVATDSDATYGGRFYRISSRLRVSAAEWSDPEAEFSCTVSFFNGTGTSLHVAEISGDHTGSIWNTEEPKLSFLTPFILPAGVEGDGMTRGKICSSFQIKRG